MSEHDISEPVVIREDEERMKSKVDHFKHVISNHDDLKISICGEFDHEFALERLQLESKSVAFIVPTNVMLKTLVSFDEEEPLGWAPYESKVERSCSFYIRCTKKSFSNWKLLVHGNQKEINHFGFMLLERQLTQFNYITIEISKFKFQKLRAMNITSKDDITLIPTGYDGYLVNITLYQENLYQLIEELTDIHEGTKSSTVAFKPSRVLNSKNPFTVPWKTGPLREIGNHIQPMNNIEKFMALTKPEVSFLLGRNGDRVNTIRDSTGCLIYILPISKHGEFLSHKRTPQTIKLVGTPDKIENALQMINDNLAIFHDNGSHFL